MSVHVEANSLFSAIDKDGDGKIDKDEFHSARNSLSEALHDSRHTHATDHRKASLFAMVDADGSGNIDRSEFNKARATPMMKASGMYGGG